MTSHSLNRLFISSAALVFSLSMAAPSYGQFNLFDHDFGNGAGEVSLEDAGFTFPAPGSCYGSTCTENLLPDSTNVTGGGGNTKTVAGLDYFAPTDPNDNYTLVVEYNAGGNTSTFRLDYLPFPPGTNADGTLIVGSDQITLANVITEDGQTIDPATQGIDMTIPHVYTIHRTGGGANNLNLYLDGETATPLLTASANANSNSTNNGKMTMFFESPGVDPGFARRLHRLAAGDGNVFAGPPGPEPRTFTWKLTGSGDWNQRSNWDPRGAPSIAPNGNHDAIFADTTLAGSTVFTDTAVSVRRIDFDHDQTYVLAGFGSVNLASGTDSAGDVPPVVNTLQGTHEFQVRVNLHNNSTVNVASNSTLMFSNTLNLMGHILTKTGVGTMSIRNDFVTGGGTLNIADGTVSGNGTIGGSVDNNGGVISPGNNAVAAGSQVPEPASLLVLVLGGLLVCWAWGRRNWVLGECRA